MNKVYHGKRHPKRNVVTVNGKVLDECLDITNHSPDGFEWGYGGSGPSQLSLAIACDLFGKSKKNICSLAYDIKCEFISKIKADEFVLSDREILSYLRGKNEL